MLLIIYLYFSKNWFEDNLVATVDGNDSSDCLFHANQICTF